MKMTVRGGFATGLLITSAFFIGYTVIPSGAQAAGPVFQSKCDNGNRVYWRVSEGIAVVGQDPTCTTSVPTPTATPTPTPKPTVPTPTVQPTPTGQPTFGTSQPPPPPSPTTN